jgi:hypothetical protein
LVICDFEPLSYDTADHDMRRRGGDVSLALDKACGRVDGRPYGAHRAEREEYGEQ